MSDQNDREVIEGLIRACVQTIERATTTKTASEIITESDQVRSLLIAVLFDHCLKNGITAKDIDIGLRP